MLVVALVFALVGPVAAQQAPGEVRMVPYVSEQMNCAGLRPDGWIETSMGTYASVVQGGTLIQQAGPINRRAKVLEAWLGQFGIEALPEPYASYAGEYLTFDLYQLAFPVPGGTSPVDFALAETRTQVFTAAIFAEPPVYAFLHDVVFLPALEAYRPGTDPVEVPLDPAEIVLLPFDTTASASFVYPWVGVRPAGWRMVMPGLYRREIENTTPAQLIYAVLPNVPLDYLTTIIPLGLQETYHLPAPPESSEVEAAARTWTIYRADVTDQGHEVVIVAAVSADDQGFGYQVNLVSAPDESDGLYDAVLLPALQAFEVRPHPAAPAAVTS